MLYLLWHLCQSRESLGKAAESLEPPAFRRGECQLLEFGTAEAFKEDL